MKQNSQKAESQKDSKFVEGVDYYFENGLMVLTAHFLLKRGYCCGNGCRHCPYPKEENKQS
jgi:hypothetical protein